MKQIHIHNRTEDRTEGRYPELTHSCRCRRFVYTGLKRRRQLKLRIMKLVLACAVLMAAVTVGSSIRSYASDTDHRTFYKYYTSITVPYGMDLMDIAEEYFDADAYGSEYDFVCEICSINRISGEYDLRPGESLIIPYYSEIFK